MQLVVLANSPDDAASFGDFVMTNGRISPPPDMVLCTSMIDNIYERNTRKGGYLEKRLCNQFSESSTIALQLPCCLG